MQDIALVIFVIGFPICTSTIGYINAKRYVEIYGWKKPTDWALAFSELIHLIFYVSMIVYLIK